MSKTKYGVTIFDDSIEYIKKFKTGVIFDDVEYIVGYPLINKVKDALLTNMSNVIKIADDHTFTKENNNIINEINLKLILFEKTIPIGYELEKQKITDNINNEIKQGIQDGSLYTHNKEQTLLSKRTQEIDNINIHAMPKIDITTILSYINDKKKYKQYPLFDYIRKTLGYFIIYDLVKKLYYFVCRIDFANKNDHSMYNKMSHEIITNKFGEYTKLDIIKNLDTIDQPHFDCAKNLLRIIDESKDRYLNVLQYANDKLCGISYNEEKTKCIRNKFRFTHLDNEESYFLVRHNTDNKIQDNNKYNKLFDIVKKGNFNDGKKRYFTYIITGKYWAFGNVTDKFELGVKHMMLTKKDEDVVLIGGEMSIKIKAGKTIVKFNYSSGTYSIVSKFGTVFKKDINGYILCKYVFSLGFNPKNIQIKYTNDPILDLKIPTENTLNDMCNTSTTKNSIFFYNSKEKCINAIQNKQYNDEDKLCENDKISEKFKYNPII